MRNFFDKKYYDRTKEWLNLVVVRRALVEGTGEGSGTLRTAEEETASPEGEERHSEWNGDQQADQHSDEYRGVFFRSRFVQIQAAQMPTE